jgi:hypothetical protein
MIPKDRNVLEGSGGSKAVRESGSRPSDGFSGLGNGPQVRIVSREANKRPDGNGSLKPNGLGHASGSL